MAVYVDNLKIPWRRDKWCHLVADTSWELHDFAKRLGLRRDWFQEKAVFPHYDINERMHAKAILMGAKVVHPFEIVSCAARLKKEITGNIENSNVKPEGEFSKMLVGLLEDDGKRQLLKFKLNRLLGGC